MVEALLEVSRSLNYTDPGEMMNLAELALFASERLDAKRYGREVMADVRARAWAELANAHRVADDLGSAEQAMCKAVSWQRRGSGDPLLLVRIADLMASLLANQRRFSEAIELQGKLQTFYLQRGDEHLAGRALIKEGMYTSDDNNFREALFLIAEGLALIDLDRDEKLGLLAFNSLVTNMVKCGRLRQARIHLWRGRALYQAYGDPLTLLRFDWLQAQIAAGLGDFERAEQGFLAIQQAFAEARQPYNAALVGLDLAALWVTLGKTVLVRGLVEEMITTFRALRIAREAVAALLILREACDREEATVERVRAVTMLLTELERQPARRSDDRRG
ncbi:MAG TPA: hypothetical protein VHR45_07150 [Thermoanaerobaculia bacterium]|nr:hypothetical protein [Thermoanaerobaculia bacterium]